MLHTNALFINLSAGKQTSCQQCPTVAKKSKNSYRAKIFPITTRPFVLSNSILKPSGLKGINLDDIKKFNKKTYIYIEVDYYTKNKLTP